MTTPPVRRRISPAAMPVVGELTRDPAGDLLQSEFSRFASGGIHGLAKVMVPRLDLLAFRATQPGTGQLSRFLTACQAAYLTIVVWEIVNPVVPDMLERRGFGWTTATDEDGSHPVMRWDRP